MNTTSILPIVEVNGKPVPSAKECVMKTWQHISPHLRTPNQSLGQVRSMGCVSLEITQRCNLDCTLCYLSEMSEKTLDVPMEELKRRAGEILLHYGPGTGVQISGGDPTLRKESELIEIVKYVADLGMEPALLTNGIKASRELIKKLVDVGLKDIAIHVDMTQRLRKADKTYYQSEEELNEKRLEYIERVRGLGVAMIFNTTLFPGNFHELPMLVNFFKDHADVVGMASFQLGADTGRGEHRGRDEDAIEPRNIIEIINTSLQKTGSLGSRINFDVIDIGHPSCNRIGYGFVSNKRVYDMWWDPTAIPKFNKKFQGLQLDRGKPKEAVMKIIGHVLKHPSIIFEGFRFIGRHVWRMKSDLLASRLKVYKISYFIHNFMHADALDAERIHNCSFMVMTPNGPMSMCEHNARRDDYITQEVTYKAADGTEKQFHPVRENQREFWERRKKEKSALSVE